MRISLLRLASYSARSTDATDAILAVDGDLYCHGAFLRDR